MMGTGWQRLPGGRRGKRKRCARGGMGTLEKGGNDLFIGIEEIIQK
jgi:hypothetical protein